MNYECQKVGQEPAESPLALSRPDNVIIVTGGLTGSSVRAGVLAAAGHWSGDDTFKKHDCNTYENAELIALNRQLLSTYDGVLYRKPKTLRDTGEAGLIYFKNYQERLC